MRATQPEGNPMTRPRPRLIPVDVHDLETALDALDGLDPDCMNYRAGVARGRLRDAVTLARDAQADHAAQLEQPTGGS